jgi:hypothetical protein
LSDPGFALLAPDADDPELAGVADAGAPAGEALPALAPGRAS